MHTLGKCILLVADHVFRRSVRHAAGEQRDAENERLSGPSLKGAFSSPTEKIMKKRPQS